MTVYHFRNFELLDSDAGELRGGFELIVGHRAVGGAEVYRSFGDLANTPAGADGLVVDLHVRMHLAVCTEPLGVDGVREGRPGSVDILCERT